MNQQVVSTKPAYFPNLDGLRFIGSLLIIVFHIEDIKLLHNKPVIPFIEYYGLIGNFDVSLFFVLSGFLITYLLLKEKKESGSINLKAYYARRTLRIWPLYYLILILGFFVLPHLGAYFSTTYSANIYKNFWLSFTGCFLFLCPLVRSASGLPQTMGPIWSVGVEELFYLCWPLFLRKTTKYLLLFFVVLVVVLLLRNGFFLGDYFFGWDDSFHKIYKFISAVLMQYRISCMAIGAMGAYWVVFEKKKILSFLYRKDIQWIVYIITAGLLLLRVGVKIEALESFPSVFHEVYSVLFIIIIVNLATNPKSIVRLDYKWTNYLGKISYGLYMYHPIMRILSLELTTYLFKGNTWNWQMNVSLYFFTVSSTILISILSYEFFEKKFLKLKNKVTAQA